MMLEGSVAENCYLFTRKVANLPLRAFWRVSCSTRERFPQKVTDIQIIVIMVINNNINNNNNNNNSNNSNNDNNRNSDND